MSHKHSRLGTRYSKLIVALIVLVGSILRCAGLGKESIWLDEATSIIIARMNLSSVVAWAAGDIHPPLYYLTLHFWLYLGESEFVVRALSVVLGIVTIVVAYALARELFGQRVGLLSALLLALSPLHIGYSQEARMYVMVTLWSLLASYWMLKALRIRDWRYWLGYVLATVLALYTHYFALFVLLFQNLFVVYWLWRIGNLPLGNRGQQTLELQPAPGHSLKNEGVPKGWWIAQLAIVLLFLPWVPILYHQATTGGGGWVERSVGQPSLRSLVDTWVYFSIGLDAQSYPALLRRAAYVLFGICGLFAVTRLFAQSRTAPSFTGQDDIPKGMVPGKSQADREGVLFCLAYVSVPLLTVWLLSQVKPMYTIRYLLLFLPAYCILVAEGVERMSETSSWGRLCPQRNWIRIVIVSLLALFLLVGDWNAWRIERNADWRGASSYVLQQAQPDDVVLFSPRWNVKPFDYYARGRVAINMDLPIPVTKSAAQEVVSDIAQRYRRVWLFWERGHYSDPDGIAKRILDSQFGLVETRNFHGVESLFLYDLKR